MKYIVNDTLAQVWLVLARAKWQSRHHVQPLVLSYFPWNYGYHPTNHHTGVLLVQGG